MATPGRPGEGAEALEECSVGEDDVNSGLGSPEKEILLPGIGGFPGEGGSASPEAPCAQRE